MGALSVRVSARFWKKHLCLYNVLCMYVCIIYRLKCPLINTLLYSIHVRPMCTHSSSMLDLSMFSNHSRDAIDFLTWAGYWLYKKFLQIIFWWIFCCKNEFDAKIILWQIFLLQKWFFCCKKWVCCKNNFVANFFCCKNESVAKNFLWRIFLLQKCVCCKNNFVADFFCRKNEFVAKIILWQIFLL